MNGLIFYLDAANPRCYSGSGITVNNIVGGTGGTLDGTTFSSANSGIFTFDGVNDYIDTSFTGTFTSNATIVMWLQLDNLNGEE